MSGAPLWLVAFSVLADVALFAWWTRRRRARRRDARATLDAVRDWFWWREIAHNPEFVQAFFDFTRPLRAPHLDDERYLPLPHLSAPRKGDSA